MKRRVNILFCVLLGLVVTSSSLFAQTATGAEARLKEKNIILPPVLAPVANYVELSTCRKLAVSGREHSRG